MYRIEQRDSYIDLFDGEGLLLGDIELGWIDRATGNYVVPGSNLARWIALIQAANKGSAI